MAQKPETLFKNRIRPLLDRLSSSHWFKIQQVAICGTPDFLGVVRGRFVALELKASEKARVSELQFYHLDKISKAGGFGLVVSPENWLSTYEFLKKLSRGEQE